MAESSEARPWVFLSRGRTIFTGPLAALLQGTREIASGNVSYQVVVRSDDELGYLARSFNSMARRLEENRRVLDEHNLELERKVFERTLELMEREEELTSILENNPAGIILADAETDRITWANSNALKIMGGSKEQILCRPFGELFSPKADRGSDSGEFDESAESRESVILTVDGGRISVWQSVSRITYENREHYLHAFFDITEHKRLESQLMQAQKMGAVGTLAGGIAHDFNNLLQIILGCVQLLIIQGGHSCSAENKLQEIESSVRRGSALIRQLLTFSRKVESCLKPVDLNEEVEKITALLKRTIPRMIVIELNLSPDLRKINADAAQLEQVVMNLAVNARDAMRCGGRLIFETGNELVGEDDCDAQGEIPPGEYAVLTISDTGEGMAPHVLERIFEPFFTTKEVGKGTGLGLSMVYGIIKSHRGHVACSSALGEGTVFRLFFPVPAGPECVEGGVVE